MVSRAKWEHKQKKVKEEKLIILLLLQKYCKK